MFKRKVSPEWQKWLWRGLGARWIDCESILGKGKVRRRVKKGGLRTHLNGLYGGLDFIWMKIGGKNE